MKKTIHSFFVFCLVVFVSATVPSVIGNGSYDVLAQACQWGGNNNATQIRCQDAAVQEKARTILNNLWVWVQEFEAQHHDVAQRTAQLEKIIDATYLKAQQTSHYDEKLSYEIVHFYLKIFLKSYRSYDSLYGYE